MASLGFASALVVSAPWVYLFTGPQNYYFSFPWDMAVKQPKAKPEMNLEPSGF